MGDKKQIIIRVPLVPGINDTAENLAATARLAEEVNAREIHILPFHQLGNGKMARFVPGICHGRNTGTYG